MRRLSRNQQTAKKGGDLTRDRIASFTQKQNKTYRDYKANINTGTNGFITDYRFDTAKMHVSQHIDELIEDEAAAYADNAYMSKRHRKNLKKQGCF